MGSGWEMDVDTDVETAVTNLEQAVVIGAVGVVFGRNVRNKRCFYHLTLRPMHKI